MIVYDTEDDSAELLTAGKSGFGKTVTQIAAISTRTGKRFYNTGQPKPFLKWCHEIGDDIWAFNQSYDIGNLCHTGEIKFDDFDVTMVKGRFIKGIYEGMNFHDVRNLCGGNLAELGLAVDLPKYGWFYTPEQYAKFSKRGKKDLLGYFEIDENVYLELCKATEAVRTKWTNVNMLGRFSDKRYVFRDCKIPAKWLKFVKDETEKMGIPKIPGTLGSLCVKAFAASGGENWHEASDESQSGLRGARVEIFNHGGSGRIAYTDINSLYPYCLTMKFPTCMENLGSVGWQDKETYGIVKCSVKVPKTEFVAPLPWRDESGRLLFPVGKFSGVWTVHELKNAMKHGTEVFDVQWALGSYEGKAFYRDYILETYDKRLASKSPSESLFWKLLMNNLYGRLAISGELSRSLLLTDENKDSGIPYGRKILANHHMPLPDFSNYLHAAYVLSYARIHLYSFLKKIPRNDLIYCDTDSTIFFCQGEIPFPISKELGAMKLEKMLSKVLPVLPKVLVKDDEFIAKGVPKKHAKDFIVHGSAEYDSPYKMREHIRYYDEGQKRRLSVWRKVEKIRKAEYDKKRNSGVYFLPMLLK